MGEELLLWVVGTLDLRFFTTTLSGILADARGGLHESFFAILHFIVFRLDDIRGLNCIHSSPGTFISKNLYSLCVNFTFLDAIN